MTTLSIITSAIARQVALREELRNANIHKAGAEPTVDANGRLHAPCDGYVWEGKIYSAGEYVGDTTDTSIETLKIKILASLGDAFASVFEGSCGKTWNNYGGLPTCYFYASVPSWQAKLIKPLLPTVSKRIVIVDDDDDGTQKTWKFNYAKSLALIEKKVF